jgi:hypothetical protein
LLLRAYARGRFKLLFWSFLCFAGLALTNLLLVLDRLVFTSVDLSSWRLGVALAAIVLLLYGLIFEKTS